MRKELQTVIAELEKSAPDDTAVHEARKSVKKSRAVLRLLRDDLGSDYSLENRRLRDAAHRLSSIRDADVTRETLHALHGRYPNLVTTRIVNDVDAGLRGRRRRVKAHADRQVSRAMSAVRQTLDSAPAEVRRAATFSAVRAGVTRGYQRARREMVGLDPRVDASALHAWRRRVKDHWYHVRLFAGMHPGARGRMRGLDRLETWLGEDHDLAVLEGIILDAPDRFSAARDTAIVLGCIAKRHMALRDRAIRLGHRLFARKPRDFADSVTAWRASRSR